MSLCYSCCFKTGLTVKEEKIYDRVSVARFSASCTTKWKSRNKHRKKLISLCRKNMSSTDIYFFFLVDKFDDAGKTDTVTTLNLQRCLRVPLGTQCTIKFITRWLLVYMKIINCVIWCDNEL